MADEGVFCLRWTFPADGERAVTTLARLMATPESSEEQLREILPKRLRKQMHSLIGGEQNAPFFEQEFHRIYETLDAHFAARRYLLGPRPTLADFALWGQSKQLLDDPTAGGWMRRDYPHAARWVERFTAGSFLAEAQATGDWIDPIVLEPILRRLEASYFPWVLGNRHAVAAGSKTFRFQTEGFAIDFPAGGYLEKCFAAIEERHRALPADERRAVDAVVRWPT